MNLDIVKHKWLRQPYILHATASKRVKKPRASVLFIHGIGTSSDVWDKITAKLPPNINIVTVDLLGFGLSPRPQWAVYDAKLQARSIVATYRRLCRQGPVIIVGHSLGALVAVEIAKLYPRLVRSLVLCSAPFYAVNAKTPTVAASQKVLTSLYGAIQSHPDQFVKISRIAAKYNIINRAFTVDENNVHAYMSALEASIVNQTAYDDIRQLTMPIVLTYGTLDAVVVTKNLKNLAKTMPNASIKSVVAAHEIRGPYISVVANQINTMITPPGTTTQ
ncbi:MAG: alpha/beta hydrolase [Candidatus Saccharimonadales bacterium]